uniref:Uncharacterized protein n=1 Tax=viral metagenome TaxID=1070528 RepID=A0A6M3Y389_9ZZZZ
MAGLLIQHIVLPNGKELVFFGQRAYQRLNDQPWEPFDQKILENTPIPRQSIVEQRVF